MHDAIHFVAALTRIGIDHVRLRRGNFPSFLTLSARVHHVVLREQQSCHDTLRVWCALGYRPSCFHRSVAAEAIHEAKLSKRERMRVVSFLSTLFQSLHKLPIPQVVIRPVTVLTVLHARLKMLESSV